MAVCFDNLYIPLLFLCVVCSLLRVKSTVVPVSLSMRANSVDCDLIIETRCCNAAVSVVSIVKLY